jgi:YD repeat-containing protein
MQGSFAASVDEITWVVTSYLVATGVTIPLTGWIAARVGRKWYFIISVLMFVAGSMLCGFATGLHQIVLLRIMQGAAGAAMMPLAQSILFETFPPSEHTLGDVGLWSGHDGGANPAADAAGRIVGLTDPFGSSTSYGYDQLEDLTQIVDGLGAMTEFSYDHDRNLLSVTDANGNTTSYTYDAMDRPVSRTDPLGATDSYAYDGGSNLISHTDRRGKVTVYQYDGLNRRTFAGFGRNGSNYESTINYTWDGGNRLTQAGDSVAGTISRTYNGLDRLTDEQSPQGEVSYSYNAAGRHSTMQVAGQSQNARQAVYD